MLQAKPKQTYMLQTTVGIQTVDFTGIIQLSAYLEMQATYKTSKP